MEASIQSKMRLDKCDAYTSKEIIGYRGEYRTCQLQEKQQKEKKNRERQNKKQAYRLTIGAPQQGEKMCP